MTFSLLIFLYFVNPTWAATPSLMAAMGDSITFGFLADSQAPKTEDFYSAITSQLSWATGHNTESHFSLLSAYMRTHGLGPLDSINVAIPRNQTSAMESQAKRIVKAVHEGGYSLKYVTVLIGANDLCSPRNGKTASITAMRKNILKGFKILDTLQQDEPVRILISSLPRIPDLAKPEISNAKTAFGLSCHMVRDKLIRYCNGMLSWKNQDEYAAQISQIIAANQMLEQLSQQAPQLFRHLDIEYSPSIFNSTFGPELLAADCFHPNEVGHRKISLSLWQDQTWFH